MRLHRPTITVEVLVDRLADLNNRDYTDNVRLVSAEFWRRQGAAGYHGTVVEMVLGVEPPAGARWVDSELHHPTPTLTLHTSGGRVADVIMAAELFVAGSGRHATITAVNVDEHNRDEYRGTVTLRLGERRPTA